MPDLPIRPYEHGFSKRPAPLCDLSTLATVGLCTLAWRSKRWKANPILHFALGSLILFNIDRCWGGGG
jgi:hypothetical protein